MIIRSFRIVYFISESLDVKSHKTFKTVAGSLAYRAHFGGTVAGAKIAANLAPPHWIVELPHRLFGLFRHLIPFCGRRTPLGD
jgi:hypothetical protein